MGCLQNYARESNSRIQAQRMDNPVAKSEVKHYMCYLTAAEKLVYVGRIVINRCYHHNVVTENELAAYKLQGWTIIWI